MNFLRDRLFSGTAFSVNNHTEIGRSYEVDLLEKVVRNLAVTHNIARLGAQTALAGRFDRVGAAVRRRRGNILLILILRCFGIGNGLLYGHQDFVREQGFGNVIVCAQLHHIHCNFDI
ncbi:hypothetical protein D3C87_1821100 [compost metagenome]